PAPTLPTLSLHDALPIYTPEPALGNYYKDANSIEYFGVQDTGNATFEGSRRYLPSLLDALVLHDVYGYDIVEPQTFGDFYTDLEDRKSTRRTPVTSLSRM